MGKEPQPRQRFKDGSELDLEHLGRALSVIGERLQNGEPVGIQDAASELKVGEGDLSFVTLSLTYPVLDEHPETEHPVRHVE